MQSCLVFSCSLVIVRHFCQTIYVANFIGALCNDPSQDCCQRLGSWQLFFIKDKVITFESFFGRSSERVLRAVKAADINFNGKVSDAA
jgi:hypothetical protein